MLAVAEWVDGCDSVVDVRSETQVWAGRLWGAQHVRRSGPSVPYSGKVGRDAVCHRVPNMPVKSFRHDARSEGDVKDRPSCPQDIRAVLEAQA